MIGKKINQLATELAPASTDLTIIGNPTTGVSKKITLAQLGAIFSGAVSFYTNYASFPTPGTTDVIFCAKDTQKLYLWSGSAYVEVFPSQALLDTYQLRSEKGVSNGYASLDSSGKVPISQLPSSIMEYKGTWSAATNTPTLANGTGDTGDVYLCNAAGTVNFGAGPLTFAVGDYVVYSGTIWQRSSGAVGTVTSVAASITGNAIGITGSPVTTSGTLALAFAGTSAQYVNGAGNLITFPSIISQAQNLVTEVYNETGATLTKGTIVYINGGHGNLPTVTKALATGDSTSAQTYGIVQADITNNNNGYVVAAGRLENIDTQAYTEGTQLYLSSTTAGTWTSTKQYAPAHLVYVGIIVRSHPTQGIVEIKIQNGYEMDELHNVAAQSPTNNDGLFWEASTSLWKNKSIATILGYTPQAQLNGTGFVKASGTTISYDNSTYVTTDTFQTISASKTFGVGFSIASAGGTNQLTSFLNTNSIHSGSAGTNVFGFNNSNNIYFGKGLSNGGVITYNNSAVRFYALPDADGTIALVGGSGVGTVTSVGLSSATSGVTIGSTPITTSGTITLAIATASGSQQGLLSSTDWTTFNNKQSALTNPVTGTGTTNYLPKFTGTSTIGNSGLSDDGTTVTLNSRALSGTSASFSSNVTTSASFVSNITNGYGLILNRAAVSNYNGISLQTASSAKWFIGMRENLSSNNYIIYSEQIATDVLKLDVSTGTATFGSSVGLGVTPNNSTDPSLESRFGLFMGRDEANILNNAYYNAGWKYAQTGFANRYYQNIYNGGHQWLIAPSGTAGNAISFTQAMTLNASGNLSIGNTNDTYKLDVSGTGRFTKPLYLNSASNTAGSQGFLLFNYAASNAGSRSWKLSNDQVDWGDFAIQVSTTQTGSTYITPLNIASTGAATFSSSVTLSSSAGNLDVGGVAIIRGNGSAYSTHELTTGAANVALYDQRNAAGTVINRLNAGGTSYFNGGNVGIGTTSPQRILTVYNSNAATLYQTPTSGTGASDGFYVGQTSDVSYVWNYNSFPLVFATANTERMRINSSGDLELKGRSTTTNFQAVLYNDNSQLAINATDTTTTKAINFNISSSVNAMSIKSSGIINIANVPSSSAGLSTGDIYKTVAGVLMIV